MSVEENIFLITTVQQANELAWVTKTHFAAWTIPFKIQPDGSSDKTKVICCLCKSEFNYHRSNSSLNNHLKSKHPDPVAQHSVPTVLVIWRQLWNYYHTSNLPCTAHTIQGAMAVSGFETGLAKYQNIVGHWTKKKNHWFRMYRQGGTQA